MYDSLQGRNDELLGLVNGVYIGIVTDNKDPENLGRVRVKIPVLDNQNAMNWARVATLMAGKQRGSLFLPEVGDEVLIAFQMGDLREPIVIGSMWNKNAPPPNGKDERNNIRKITTRAGHEIIFDDTDGDGKITLKTQSGHALVLSDKQDQITLQEQSGQHTLKIKGGSANQIELASGSSKIMLNNKGTVTIESVKEVKLKAAQIALEATATLDLKASAALNLKSDGIVTVKGSIVKIN